MIVFKFAIGLISTASLVALAIYACLVYRGKSELLYSTIDSRQMDWQKKVFLGLAAFGFLACIFNGIDGLLFWMPDSWGSLDEEGDFKTVRTSLASIGTLFIGGILVQVIDGVTHDKFRLQMQRVWSKGLEDILQASRHRGSLERLKAGYQKRIEELAATRTGPLTMDSHRTMLGQEMQMLQDLICQVDEQIKQVVPV